MRNYLICLSLVCLIFPACSEEAPIQAEQRSITAQTVRLVKTQALECRSLPGQVRSRTSVVLSSKISGTVTEILAEEGATLQAGQAIMRIDDAELHQREQGARAIVGQTNLERQAVAARLAQAKATLKRMRVLLGVNAVSREELDRAQADYDALENQEKALGAQAMAAQFQSAEVRSLLRYSTVSAPVHGVLTRRYVDLGTFVQAGNPLAEVEDVHSGFDLEALADESLLGQVRPGMLVLAVVPALAQTPFSTTLNTVVGQVDPANRSFRIKAAVEGPARAGMFGKLCIPVTEAEKLLVPSSCLRPRGELMTALIVDDQDVLRLRLIKIGAHYQKAELDGRTFLLQAGADQLGQLASDTDVLVEVLSGLFPGEEIVRAAPDVAREGDRMVRR